MHRILLALSCVLFPLAALGDDWPQFRGPGRDGISKEKGLLKAWPKAGLKPAWTCKTAGLGFSGIAVSKGVIYTLGTDWNLAEKDLNKAIKNDIIIALDEKTGTQLWTVKLAPLFTFPNNIWGDGPRSTPTIDGNFLYALGGDGDLVCVDVTKKGAEVWRKNLAKDFGGEMMTEWGFSESPLIDGDKLICTPGGANGTLAALDKTTGKLLWQSKKWTDKAPYSSAVVAEINGVRQYVQTGYISDTKGGVLAGVDTKGDLLWSTPIFKQSSYAICPSPIVNDNLVYATSGYGGGCHLFEIGKKWDAKEQFSKANQKKVKNTLGGVVLVGNHVYGHTETQKWFCQDFKTGNVEWDETNELKCASGATIAADGMLYLYTDEGTIGLVEASPKQWTLVSSFTIPERSKFPGAGGRKSSKDARPWAIPVIANGVLYLRDHELIFAFPIKK